jgi:hypothetical protein
MLSNDSAVPPGSNDSVHWSWPVQTADAVHKYPLLEKRGPYSRVGSDTFVYNKHQIVNINFT